MSLKKIIKDLERLQDVLTEVIVELKALDGDIGAQMSSAHITYRRRRGRKSMSAKERQEVSERMKKFWAGQRTQKPEGGT